MAWCRRRHLHSSRPPRRMLAWRSLRAVARLCTAPRAPRRGFAAAGEAGSLGSGRNWELPAAALFVGVGVGGGIAFAGLAHERGLKAGGESVQNGLTQGGALVGAGAAVSSVPGAGMLVGALGWLFGSSRLRAQPAGDKAASTPAGAPRERRCSTCRALTRGATAHPSPRRSQHAAAARHGMSAALKRAAQHFPPRTSALAAAPPTERPGAAPLWRSAGASSAVTVSVSGPTCGRSMLACSAGAPTLLAGAAGSVVATAAPPHAVMASPGRSPPRAAGELRGSDASLAGLAAQRASSCCCSDTRAQGESYRMTPHACFAAAGA